MHDNQLFAHSEKQARLLGCLFGLAVALGGCNNQWRDNAVEETKQRGDNIVLALNRFFKEHSSLPESLKALAPHYIDPIQPPVVGAGSWQYHVYSWKGTTYFVLTAATKQGDEPRLEYNSRFGCWMLDTK